MDRQFSAIYMKVSQGQQVVDRVVSEKGQAAIADYTCDGQLLFSRRKVTRR